MQLLLNLVENEVDREASSWADQEFVRAKATCFQRSVYDLLKHPTTWLLICAITCEQLLVAALFVYQIAVLTGIAAELGGYSIFMLVSSTSARRRPERSPAPGMG